jgi:outer membrane lipoprotein-sorting protein
MNRSRRIPSWLLPWLLLSIALQAEDSPPATLGSPTPLTAQQVVQQLIQKNEERAAALRSYQGSRHYTLQYTGFPGNRQAEMVVNMTYQAPNKKNFTIVSQSGSKLLIDRVLKRLLDSEQEALDEENRTHTALTPDNYDFALAGYEIDQGKPMYVLNVDPKIKNKFLYKGKIWVDGTDFAVARIQAEPAKNPSFWTKKNEIDHTYTKVQGFWLPKQNHTVTAVRLGGRAVLTIDYLEYRITEAAPLPPVKVAKKAS